MTEKLNVILITTDAHRAECYGFENSKIKTPHMDILAKEGARFSACMAPHVLCQPARASILTGLLPLTHGVYDNGIDLAEDVGAKGFAGRFAKAGYFTGFVGKAHLASRHTFHPTGTPGNHHLPSKYGPDWTGPYMGFEHVELAVNGHNLLPPIQPPIGQHYEGWYYRGSHGDKKNRLHQTRLSPDIGAPLTWNSALPPAWHNSTWVGDRTIDLLKNNTDRPVCMWVSFPDPHPPFDAPEPWCRMHDPDNVDLPPHRRLDLERRPWWHAACLREPGRIFDDPRMPDEKKKKGFVRVAPESDTQLRHMLANYYGAISLVDHNVGRILTALDELGMTERTLVICTADHGFYMGDHGLLLQNPMMYESLLRVGLVMNGPGIPRNLVVDDPVSTLDLGATMQDYCGVGADARIHGRSLRPLVEGRGETRDFAYLEWDVEPARYCIGKELKLRTVRTKTHKLTLELNSGAGELYDLRNDPDEMDNLFDDAGYLSVRKELADMIASRPKDEIEPRPERVGYF